MMVGPARFELATFRPPDGRANQAAPIARCAIVLVVLCEVETGFEPVYTALQAVASPLGHSTAARPSWTDVERTTGFEPATLTLAR